MGTSFTELYESVLSKIRDYDFLNLEQSDIYEVLSDYVRPAIASFHVCRQDLSKRNETGFECTLTDMEIEILSNYMVIAYLDSNYIRVPMALKLSLSSKDFNAFSPANQLDKLVSMRETFRKDNETLLSRYSWHKQST
jgi:hypothetical protein